jgi:membrane fusion protein, multidrug efflux system
MSLVARHRSSLTIAGVAVALAAWILSGVLTREPPRMAPRAPASPMSVGVMISDERPVERLLTLHGEIEPDQRVLVRAQTAGRIEAVSSALGERVDAGDEIARIAMDDREARLRKAMALVRGHETDYSAARRLAREGLQAQLQEETALSRLESARAELEAIRLDIDNTRLRAPIDGVINHRHAEIGDYVTVAAPVAEIIENHPLRAVVQVPQHSVHRVRAGGKARVTFVDDSEHEGEVRFISVSANTATRTFRVEILLQNEDRALPSGVSVQVRIPLQEVPAHHISPALVVLDEHGELGVKAVDSQNRVVVHPIQVVRADANGLWVTGLPQRVRIITLGQGFVTEGEPVMVVEEQPSDR